MSRTHETLTSLFTDIANAIRQKKGTSGTIVADNFPSEIASIGRGHNLPSEYQEVTFVRPGHTNQSRRGYILTDIIPSEDDEFIIHVNHIYENVTDFGGIIASTNSDGNKYGIYGRPYYAEVWDGHASRAGYREYVMGDCVFDSSGVAKNVENVPTIPYAIFGVNTDDGVIRTTSGVQNQLFYDIEIVNRAFFVFAFRKSDGNLGAYDIMNDKFYPSQSDYDTRVPYIIYGLPID